MAFTPDARPSVAEAALILREGASGSVRQAAFARAVTLTVCAGSTAPSIDRSGDRLANLALWSERLDDLLPPIGAATLAPVVPANAEAIPATRQPSLSAGQRRDVPSSTETLSDIPVLNDAQGYGRLNRVRAADGHGRFAGAVGVSMDASAGGFNALDAWRNSHRGRAG